LEHMGFLLLLQPEALGVTEAPQFSSVVSGATAQEQLHCIPLPPPLWKFYMLKVPELLTRVVLQRWLLLVFSSLPNLNHHLPRWNPGSVRKEAEVFSLISLNPPLAQAKGRSALRDWTFCRHQVTALQGAALSSTHPLMDCTSDGQSLSLKPRATLQLFLLPLPRGSD
jgi:hypothetical protein